MEFKDKIYNLRVGRKLSQTELSKILHVSQASVTGWETGRVKPTAETVKKLASFFGVSTNFLLNDVPQDDDYNNLVLQRLHHDPKLKLLFDKTQLLREPEMDAVLSVVQAIVQEREANDQ